MNLKHHFNNGTLVVEVSPADRDWDSLRVHRKELSLHHKVVLQLPLIYVITDKMAQELAFLHNTLKAAGGSLHLTEVNSFAVKILAAKLPHTQFNIEVKES